MVLLLVAITDMNGKICIMVLQYSLAAVSIDMNGRVCGALVQFGCHQHSECKAQFILIRLSLELSCM